MQAVYAVSGDPTRPLAGLTVGEWAPPPDRAEPAGDWVWLSLRAAAVNPHDLWTLRGNVRLPHGFPSVLGTDGAGVAEDGGEYLVHAVLGDPERGGGDATLDPDRIMLPEAGHGLLCERVLVPRANLVAKPAGLDWESAACLPTAWLTAYRMLFTRAGLRAGDRVLVQGAGGVATAALMLARAAGAEVHVVARSPQRRELALRLGAHRVGGPDERVSGDADVVIDAVGPATFAASLAAARPGGTIVTCGSATGFRMEVNLARIFSRQLRIVGSTMGTRDELERLVRFVMATGIRPPIDSVQPLHRAARQFERLEAGTAFGKLLVVP